MTALGQQKSPQKPSRRVEEIEHNRIIRVNVCTLLPEEVRSKADMFMNNINEVVVVKEDLKMKNRMGCTLFSDDFIVLYHLIQIFKKTFVTIYI